MFKKLFITALAVTVATATFAQQTKEEKLKEKGDLNKLNEGWTTKMALGTGLDQLLFINPKFGGGANQLTLKGIVTGTAAYKKGRLAWDNVGAWQFAVQKVGSYSNPFTKAVDDLKLGSKLGYQTAENSKWYYTLASTFRTQLTPTFNGNFLTAPKDAFGNRPGLVANFLAPGEFTLSPGMDYKPSDNFSVMISPASLRLWMVMDDAIAKQAPADIAILTGNQGNPITRNADGTVKDWKNIDVQFGARLSANYNQKFWEDRIVFNTALNLYSNYLREPQNIDVDWATSTKFNIFKGWGITLTTNMYYDHDIFVQVDRDNDVKTGLNGYESAGRATQFIQGLFITYDRTF